MLILLVLHFSDSARFVSVDESENSRILCISRNHARQLLLGRIEHFVPMCQLRVGYLAVRRSQILVRHTRSEFGRHHSAGRNPSYQRVFASELDDSG